jgi:4-amino-4-deoxy-L-arabinose transferase-like glycosyltransferase
MALYALGQSNHALWLPDETRDAGIAWEMSRTGDWVIPRLNGRPFLEKPPLSYAAAALSLRLWPGRPETAVRIPSALFCLGTLLCTFWIGRRLCDPLTGLLAACILGTSRAFLELGHTCLVDAGLVFWSTLAVAAGLEGDRRDQRRWWLLSALGVGGAFLSKGPVGLLLPGVALGGFLLWERRGHLLRGLPWAWMLLLVVVLAGAWLGPLSKAGYLQAYVEEHHRRLGSGVEHAGPPTFYLVRVWEDFAPWSGLLPFLAAWLWVRGRAGVLPLRLPLAWFLGCLLLLSIPSSKRGLYLLPAFPALAVMLAAMLADAGKTGWRAGWRLALGGMLARIASAALAVAAYGGRHGFGVAEAAAALGGLLAVSGAVREARRDRFGPAALTAASGLVLAWVWMLVVWAPRQDAFRAPGPLIQAALRAAPGAEVVGLDVSEPMQGALSFALQCRIPMLPGPEALAAWLERPFPSVALVQSTRERTPEELLARLESAPRLAGRFMPILSLKLRHEALVLLANPQALILPTPGGAR